ncbi:PH domain-containing protein [Mariniplasma anaerobium]|uniref:YdbS-like PH domain-containing protein n=1 Tax=Mariniplasma anaerobium TaxID=2735436 RepID=A0A7U9XXJ1_9MOLU|nr:PH domain-containing protein [Mariniplasma anaerobium]BCR35507.1 hypothetical protein MPAN_004000 [Mariniplasma anaerobium]
MNPKYHIARRKYIIDILKAFGLSFFIAITALSVLFEDENQTVNELTTKESLIILGIFLLTFIIQLVLYWMILNRHLFSDQDESFLIEKGLIYRKKIDIPYENIHSISIKRSFLNIILGVSRLQLDTGSTAAIMPEASITVDKKYAPAVKEFIEKRKTQEGLTLPSPIDYNKVMDIEEDVYYQAKWYELIYMGLLKPGFLVFSLVSIFISFGFFPLLDQIDTESSDSFALLVVIIVALIMIITGAIFLMLFNLIKYYKYQLIIEEKTITYKYGLLNKVEFKIHKNRINAYHITQSLLYRVFHFYELTVSVIGIGGQTNDEGKAKIESKSLLPITRLQLLSSALEDIGLIQETSMPYKPNKYKYLNFIILPMSILTIFTAIPYILFGIDLKNFVFPILVNALFYIVCFVGLYLRLKHHEIYMTKNILSFQRGAFTIKKSYIQKVKIQKITYRKNPVLQIEKIGDIIVRYKDLLGIVRMRSYEPEIFDLLVKSIKQ